MTSECGNVTVAIAASGPSVELAPTVVRMFARDLAELITRTARSAAEAHMAEAAAEEGRPSIADTIDHLDRLRTGLETDGLTAVLDAHRAELEDPEDRAAREERKFEGVPHLALPQSVVDTLGSTIDLLKRLDRDSAGAGKGRHEPEQPVGKATSPSRLVAVEATPGYPIASLWLSKRACEVGPKVLAADIEETAAAAGRDLADRQDEHFTAMGVPIGPGDVAGLSEEIKGMSAQADTDMTTIRQYTEDMTRSLYQGGYFGQR